MNFKYQMRENSLDEIKLTKDKMVGKFFKPSWKTFGKDRGEPNQATACNLLDLSIIYKVTQLVSENRLVHRNVDCSYESRLLSCSGIVMMLKKSEHTNQYKKRK